MERNADHCWFARDVTATMWCVGGQEKKNKNISLLLELNPIFIENPLRKNSIVMTTNMAAFFHVAESQESPWTYRTYLHI